MASKPALASAIHSHRQKLISRRALLRGAGGAAALSSLLTASALAQYPQLQEAIRQMEVMTDAALPDRWVEPTTSLVGVILEYSQGLRALDLGELEPATYFIAR